MLDRLFEEAEGVEVLDLAARAELVGTHRPDRHVGVAAEGAFLHVAVADADPLDERVECLRVGHGFRGGPHVGLGDDLQQRRPGAVEVDAAHAVEVLVERLAGVLLEVRAGQLDDLLDVADLDAHRAPDDDRQLVLADLVALREVGIEVVLAGEDRARADLRADGEAEADRAFDGAAVQHRQHAGQREVDDAGLRVRRGAERRGGGREDLRARRQLRVRLETDDDFPVRM